MKKRAIYETYRIKRKCASLCIIGVPEGEMREGDKNVFEDIRAKTSQNLKKNRHTDTGRTEGPKWNEFKQTYT